MTSNSVGGTLASRATGYLAATLASRLLQFGFFLTWVCALAAEDRGRFVLTLALASIAATLMNLGYDAVLIRSAAGPAVGRVFGTVLVSKSVLGASVCGIGSLGGFWLWGSDAKSALLSIFLFSVLLESLLASCLALLQALGRFRPINAMVVGGSALQVAGGGLVVLTGGGVVSFAVTVVAAQALRLLWGAAVVRKLAGPVAFDRGRVREFFGPAATIGLMDLLGLLFVWEDTVLVGFLAGDRVLGLYGPVRSIVGNLGMVPLAFRTALYPAFVGAARRDPEALARLYGRASQVLLALALPLAVLGSFFSGEILDAAAAGLAWATGRTRDASHLAPYLAVLAWTVPFSFLQSICSWAMFARGQERKLLVPQTLLVVLFAGALFFGIRFGGGLGAAWATAAGTCLNYLLFLPLVFSLGRVDLGRWLWRPLAAATAAGALLFLPAGWWIRAAAFTAVYGAMIRRLDVLRPGHLRDGLRGILGRESP